MAKTVLSYEKMLSILDRMPDKEEADYLLLFLTAADHKAEEARRAMEAERKEYEEAKERVAQKEAGLDREGDKAAKVDALKTKLYHIKQGMKQAREALRSFIDVIDRTQRGLPVPDERMESLRLLLEKIQQ